MTKATVGTSCDLAPIPDCFVEIPNGVLAALGPNGKPQRGPVRIIMNNLPDISDSKSASYNDEAVIGRAIPLKTYSHSENRAISTKIHFFIRKREDAATNLAHLRLIESAVYPREGTPYRPPPICKLRCGNILSSDKPLCVILLSYNVTFPTDVAWDKETYCPYKFDVDCQWHVVYDTQDLPTSERIVTGGR